jgi:hypothetical protein
MPCQNKVTAGRGEEIEGEAGVVLDDEQRGREVRAQVPTSPILDMSAAGRVDSMVYSVAKRR